MSAGPHPTTAPEPDWSDAQRAKKVAHARAILGGVDVDTTLPGADSAAQKIYDLAESLKKVNEFRYARRLLGRIRSKGDYIGLKIEEGTTPVKVGQQHALCTYKDPDLPAADRFRRALEILGEVDLLENTHAEKQESLGLRGAVYKRRWQVEGQRVDLERAFESYHAGHKIGATSDHGYNGINAAYVLDLLARDDAEELTEPEARRMVAERRVLQAREIRRELAALLPGLPEEEDAKGKSLDWLKGAWWFNATVAEAHLGLGEVDLAIAALRSFNVAKKLKHSGPPREIVAPWEFESTLTQLASLAQLQADLVELLEAGPDSRKHAAELRDRAHEALGAYLGDLAPGADRVFTGKVGLALSGGGFRASLFHLGVLAYLAERDVLRQVEVLSCVSGGSIIGAHYYLEVRQLLKTKPEHGDAGVKPKDYLDLVQRLERAFLRGVQTNIRCRVFGSVWANLRAFLQPGYTTTRRLAELYETQLFALVEDGEGDRPRYLKNLLIHPKDEGAAFKPKYDNWRRLAKVPNLVLNATTLNTGHNWQFTASWMGEPPSSIDAEIDGNYRLRRFYHGDAPRLRDKWRKWYSRPFGPPDYKEFRLGDAVAASSCVPGMFEPLTLPDLYERKGGCGTERMTVRLVDGGVYDNQGIASLLEQDCSVMIVSDASGQMDTQDHPGGSRLGTALRSFAVSQARVRQAQYRELAARRRTGLLKGLMFLHLKKDLDADPEDWRECQEPYDASDEARPAERRGPRTTYSLQKPVQRLLSAIRTDLDSFTEVEGFALMTSGYLQAKRGFKQLTSFPTELRPEEEWRFLRIAPLLEAPGPGYDDLTRQLEVASHVAGKVWRLVLLLKVVGGAAVLAAVYYLIRLWLLHGDVALLTVRTLGIFLLVLAGAVASPHIVRLIRYRQTFWEIGLRGALATVLAIVFSLHLWFLDWIFLRRGRLERLLKLRGAS